ncbi:TetR family transcriptional regulator [Ideonella margarita]|uniref:TetR family transcriptional regulator n=1 Tax=Ideonella margarita TaxID=2984191 RepID=A0ABU9C8R1_9BURK
MVRKTKAEAQETRQQILDAAEQVFATRGVARTSLQDIAGAAGVTRGAVYWHFQDKADLFEAMLNRVVMPCESALEQALANPPESTLSSLLDMVLVPFEALSTNAQTQRVFTVAMHYTEYTGDMAIAQQRHNDSLAGFIEQMHSVMLRGQAAGQIRPDLDARGAAIGLFALVDGLMRQWTLAPDSFDLLQVGRQAALSYLSGLQP